MGVPYDFACSGFGIYVCSRCGFELFSSADAVISQSNPTRPVSFMQAINGNALFKMSSETAEGLLRVIYILKIFV
jgi:peptide methionine sulfoxide reductase MsrB